MNKKRLMELAGINQLNEQLGSVERFYIVNDALSKDSTVKDVIWITNLHGLIRAVIGTGAKVVNENWTMYLLDAKDSAERDARKRLLKRPKS